MGENLNVAWAELTQIQFVLPCTAWKSHVVHATSFRGDKPAQVLSCQLKFKVA